MIIIQASNIHQGGGSVLLNEVIAGLISLQHEATIFVDERFQCDFEIKNQIQLVRVKPTVFSRLAIEVKLQRLAKLEPEWVFLFFGNLPPLLANHKKADLFFQNVIFLERGHLHQFKFRTRMKHSIEKAWLKWRLKSIRFVYVQSATVQKNFLNRFPGASVKVTPFSSAFLNAVPSMSVRNKELNFDFIYVASADPHKNHYRLFNAWVVLAKLKIFPRLLVTTDKFAEDSLRLIDNCRQLGGRIEVKTSLSRENVLDFYQQSRALIFPSLTESFGLPLLEAKQYGLDVVASELDYVRDILDPSETFDPHSEISIARAVARYLKLEPIQQSSITTAAGFISEFTQDK